MANFAPASPPPGPPPAPPRRKRSAAASPLLWAVVCLALLGGAAGGYYWFFATPAKPKMTQGIIEVGSKGVKTFVVNFFSSPAGYDWETKLEETTTVGMGALTDDRKFRPDALKELDATLRKYVGKMKDAGLPEGEIRVVSSSGVFTKFKSDDERSTARKVLAETVKTAIGKDVDFISVEDEGRYGIIASVPPDDRKDFVLIDVGSGNTKGGYFEGKGQYHAMTESLGTISYYDLLMKDKDTPLAESAAQRRDEAIGGPLKSAIALKPGLASGEKVLLIGGIVWAMTNMVHPDDRKVRVNLTAADIQAFSALVRSTSDPKTLREAVLAKMTVTDAKVRAEVEEELKKIQKTFTPDQLVAGSEILIALTKEFRLGTKQIVFFRKGHLAWPMGYLLDKGKIIS